MLKRMTYKKIMLTSLTVILITLIYLIPGNQKFLDLENKQSLEYVNHNTFTHEVYLMDSYNYIARTTVIITEENKKDIEKKARELLEFLIIEGVSESKIPNGFKPIIPADTRILTIEYVDDGIIKVNLSDEILNQNKELEEKMIESIIYTLTTIEEVKGVLIYVEGKILTKLPKTGNSLPSLLTRNYGVNKLYDIKSIKNISSVTVYYLNKYNDNYYYVPVTKYINDDREKINIIIDELASGPIYEANLMSFLSSNVKLLNYEYIENQMKLEFNSNILSGLKDKKILEEVLYSISYSINDNYEVEKVSLYVDNEEITSKCIKKCVGD